MVLNLHSFSGYEHGSGLTQALDFFRESTSICAVDAFVLISGYFGIRWKWKSFFNLAFQVFFYSFAIYGIAVAMDFIDFSKSSFLQCFKALCGSWEFIANYIVLYFLSPLLNAYCDSASRKKLTVFIIVLFFAENFIIVRPIGAINFCLLYIVGRWINKTNAVDYWGINAIKAYLFTTLLIFCCVYPIYLTTHIDAKTMCSLVVGYSYSSPLVILQAVFLFLIFARMNFVSKKVNWCAASCLSIFLIHMHPAIKHKGYYSFTESLYDKPLFEHAITLIALIAIVFFGSIIVDKVRIAISDAIYRASVWLAHQLPPKLFALETYIPKKIIEII